MSPQTTPGTDTAPARNDQLWSTVTETQDHCDFCRIPGTQYHANPGYRILKCDKCGLIWTNPLLKQVPSFTGEDTYRANEPEQKNRFREQLQAYLGVSQVKDPRNLRILEVGSGLGFFLDVCEEIGMAPEGCDLADHAVLHANRDRQRVRRGTLDGFYAGKNFDAIFAFNLIEHLPHPSLFLADCAKALRPGGTLVLETPVQEGLFHRAARIGDRLTGAKLNFYGMKPSGHIYKFSKKSFRQLASGEGVWKTIYQRNISSPWGEIWGNSSAVDLDHKGLYRFALPLAFSLANVTGQGNRVLVMLRKER
jgi:2-polyprenyl-3-methyl-5-hydroxy-6-metoxy-1,4-benzoquinol methylase